MTDRFTSALLAALNDSTEVKETDWNSIKPVLRQPIEATDADAPADTVDDSVEPARTAPWAANDPQVLENRFAATIRSGMAKTRSGQ